LNLTWHARIRPGFTVHDGDTLTRVELDIGWRTVLIGQSIRVTSSRGPINCPEVTGQERTAGVLVRDAVTRWLGDPGELWLRSHALSRDAYGRTIGEVWCGEHELGAWLLEQGLAIACGPEGKRVAFSEAELDRIVAQLLEARRA
jgi:endonuclease YncB( thermonuclease family)